MQGVGSVMVLGRGELGSSRCMGEVHRPTARSYDPARAQQPGILFSILARDASPIRQTPLAVLAQLAIGCSNPLYNPSASRFFVLHRKEVQEHPQRTNL